MKDNFIDTNVNIIESNKISTIPMEIIEYKGIIKINNHNENVTKSVEVIINYNNKKYVGIGKNLLWSDAFANLQKKLPKGCILACCMTCRYGNMCPFGTEPGHLFCTKNNKVDDDYQLMDLFDNDSFVEKQDVLSEYYCNDFIIQDMNHYTYNDYKYEYDRLEKNN